MVTAKSMLPVHAVGLCAKPASDHSRDSLWLSVFGLRDLSQHSQFFCMGPAIPLFPSIFPVCLLSHRGIHLFLGNSPHPLPSASLSLSLSFPISTNLLFLHNAAVTLDGMKTWLRFSFLEQENCPKAWSVCKLQKIRHPVWCGCLQSSYKSPVFALC